MFCRTPCRTRSPLFFEQKCQLFINEFKSKYKIIKTIIYYNILRYLNYFKEHALKR